MMLGDGALLKSILRASWALVRIRGTGPHLECPGPWFVHGGPVVVYRGSIITMAMMTIATIAVWSRHAGGRVAGVGVTLGAVARRRHRTAMAGVGALTGAATAWTPW